MAMLASWASSFSSYRRPNTAHVAKKQASANAMASAVRRQSLFPFAKPMCEILLFWPGRH